MKDNIQEARRTNPTYPDAVTIEWGNLICSIDPSPEKQGGISTERCYQDNEIISYSSVLPLLTTLWDQGCGYNANCPSASNSPCLRAWAGCVAVAQAQVMFYHKKPTNGFDWANMPVPGGTSISAVSTPSVANLMERVGNSVSMSYSGIGSGAETAKVVTSLKNNYGYSSANEVNYISTYPIENNLRYNRPVILSGFINSTDGHAWVTDGYQRTDYPNYTSFLLHMNWGWGGTSNGWYLSSSWKPTALSNFQHMKKAIINIIP